MTLWLVFALMTAAAIFAVLLPLGLRARRPADGSDAVVYKDQLAEIDRDAAMGLIGAAEAEAARVEIGRRLLSAADQPRPAAVQSHVKLRRAAAVLALVGLPMLALAIYLPLGSPRLPDFPLADRRLTPGDQSLDALIARVEEHLKQNPKDGRGWTVLAPVLVRQGRLDDAIQAYRNSIAYGGDGADRRADLGEAMVALAGGVVTQDAKAEFEHAVALDANEAKANYFLGLSAEQDGRGAAAAAIWQAMLDHAPADAPWLRLVNDALARVNGARNDAEDGAKPPPLSEQAVAAAKDMSEGDRGAMIRGMVERLAGRLKENGDDVEGWLKLVRAYSVLGDHDKAKDAVIDARKAMASDAERLRQLNEGLKTLGFDG
jgi:cytochrome c-type biogenesis protein CcmH